LNFSNSIYALFVLIIFSVSAFASKYDYIYPYISKPSFSNYGTTGLLSNPNARFLPEGSVAFSWNRMNPYLRGNILAYPFNWFEASYGYTDLNNQLYSEVYEFSGNQSLKDKGFDAKFRIFKEDKYMPAVALGFRDMAGTGLFSSEYLVASKFLTRNIDFTFGIGWGMLSQGNYSNPLTRIKSSFEERTRTYGNEGGEFSFGKFFSGPTGVFGGIEYFIPYKNGARIKLEYDGIDYNKEAFPPIPQKSKFNVGLVFPVSENLFLRMGFVRGDTFNFGFSYRGNYGKKEPNLLKNDPLKLPDNKEIYQKINTRPDLLYKSSLKFLRENNFYLQSANVDYDYGKYSVTYTQNKFQSFARSTGRVAAVLDHIAPKEIDEFIITNLNADMPMHTVSVDRDKYQRHSDFKGTEDLVINNYSIYDLDQDDYKDYEFQPTTKLPLHFYKFAPSLRSQIGGPDGFFFGDLRLSIKSELLLKENISIHTLASAGIYNNFQELKLGSDSVLPRVRTDIVQYLKQSEDLAIERLQFNYYKKLDKSIFTKFSAGLLEPMFAGFGGELIYRPLKKDWGIGLEMWDVKQRDYPMKFGLKKYRTLTGHLSFLYRHNPSKVHLTIRAGKFLAKDSGFNFDFYREFRSGARIGAFFTLTDISREEFGEGSFDKGFYFLLPIESFSTKYSRGFTGFGLRPITRDGGAILNYAYGLWSVTDQADYYEVMKNIDDFYD